MLMISDVPSYGHRAAVAFEPEVSMSVRGDSLLPGSWEAIEEYREDIVPISPSRVCSH